MFQLSTLHKPCWAFSYLAFLWRFYVPERLCQFSLILIIDLSSPSQHTWHSRQSTVDGFSIWLFHCWQSPTGLRHPLLRLGKNFLSLTKWFPNPQQRFFWLFSSSISNCLLVTSIFQCKCVSNNICAYCTYISYSSYSGFLKMFILLSRYSYPQYLFVKVYAYDLCCRKILSGQIFFHLNNFY